MEINQITAYNTQNTFGKKLLEKTCVRKTNNELENVRFFEYDPKNKEDKRQIKELRFKHWGKFALYMQLIALSFLCEPKKQKSEQLTKKQYFGIENKNGQTLAIARVEDSGEKLRIGDYDFPNCTKIDYIETKPTEIYASKERQYRGLGETLVKEIVKITKKRKRDFVILFSANDNFWNSSKFFKGPPYIKREHTGIMQLEKKDFDDYINFVENKTGLKNQFSNVRI